MCLYHQLFFINIQVLELFRQRICIDVTINVCVFSGFIRNICHSIVCQMLLSLFSVFYTTGTRRGFCTLDFVSWKQNNAKNLGWYTTTMSANGTVYRVFFVGMWLMNFLWLSGIHKILTHIHVDIVLQTVLFMKHITATIAIPRRQLPNSKGPLSLLV